MPYMQRLTWGGVALHAGELPGYPASHGCIRLPHDFAKLLFGVSRLGMTVIVTAQSDLPRLAPTRDPLPDAGALDGTNRPQWNPQRAPEGPLSIVVSGADRRIVVLRNGREIGRAPIEFDGTAMGTRAYTLRDGPDGLRWSRIFLAGEVDKAEPDASDLAWRRIKVDPAFRTELQRQIVPGTTVVLTTDSLSAGAPPVPVLQADP